MYVCSVFTLLDAALDYSHRSQIAVASYRDDNTISVILASMSRAYILMILY